MNITTTPMMAKASELGGREWTARDGSVRIYLNGWQQLVGLKVDYCKTGNISAAAYRGERISNAAASGLLTVKAYVDASGLHTGTTNGTGRHVLPEMVAALSAMLEA